MIGLNLTVNLVVERGVRVFHRSLFPFGFL